VNASVAVLLQVIAVVLTGVRTGRCITSPDNPPHKSCEIYGWCPVENDRLPLYAFTLFTAIIGMRAAYSF